MNLSHLLSSENVLCNASAASFEEAMRKMVDFYAATTGNPGATVLTALQERQKLGSFVVAPGIAFPHAREVFFDDFYVFIGLFPNGVPMADQAPVRLVVMYCVPEGKSNLYLRTMSAMARLLSKPGALDGMAGQSSGDGVIDYVAAHNEAVGEVVTARDLMETDFPVLTVDASLDDAIKMMVAKQTCDIPVVDNLQDMKYLGLITTGRLLKVGIPDYLMMMDNLNFLKTFEPFQDLLRNAQSTKVTCIIRRDAPHFEVTTPMFQVAVKLVESHVEFGVVVENGRLVGTITRFDFVHKVVGV